MKWVFKIFNLHDHEESNSMFAGSVFSKPCSGWYNQCVGLLGVVSVQSVNLRLGSGFGLGSRLHN